MNSFGIEYTSGTLAAIIGVAGAIAILIVLFYIKDKDSFLYKFMVFAGLVVGIVLAVISFTTYGVLETQTTVIIAVAAFALIIRPFRDVHFAVIFALLIMALVYIMLGELQGGSLDIIATGTGRIVLAFIVGALAFMMVRFVEAIVMLFGKLLNWFPFLLVLGVICVLEAIAIYSGYGSIMDWINSL